MCRQRHDTLCKWRATFFIYFFYYRSTALVWTVDKDIPERLNTGTNIKLTIGTLYDVHKLLSLWKK